MKSIKILCLLLAMLLLTGCVTKIGGTALTGDGEKPTTEAQTVATTEAAAETTAAATTEPTPTETVKPCEHEWEPDPIRPHTATCVKAGEEFFVCKLCKAEKAEEKAAVGHYWKIHSYVAGDCATGITHHQLCAICGAERNKTGEPGEHDFDLENPGRVEAATCTADGFMYCYCKVCGERTKVILPAGHSYEGGKCTACGEAEPTP